MNIFNAFRHHRSIVRITSKAGMGTGFWIKGRDGQWYILTCAHVTGADEAPTLAFCQSDNTYAGAYIAEVIRREEAADLAVLTCPTPPADAQALELLDIDFQEPPPFFAWGFPTGDTTVTNGRQAKGKVQSMVGASAFLQIVCDGENLVQGFSGGPIVHATMGYVLGIDDHMSPQNQIRISEREVLRTGDNSLFYASSAKKIGEILGDLFEVKTRHPYQAWLASMYHEVVLNDARGMRLSDVYVEPYLGVHESCVEKEYEGAKDNNGFYPLKRSIHQEVMAWIQGQRLNIPQKNGQVLLLLGYPGQGKTSFTKRLLHEMAHALPEKTCYLVQLKRILNPRDLKNKPLDCIREAITALAERELDIIPGIQFKNTLLVLDGLDELSIQRDISGQDIDDICQKIEEHAKHYPGLQIVLTSRYGYVQLEKIKTCDILVWQLSELSLEQQLNWLNKYKTFHADGHLTPELLEKYNKDEAYEAIKELITQPILLQMVASLPEDLSQNTNRADIYDQMFSQLVLRAWSEDKKQITLLKKDEGGKLLREALGEMAFEIFHSDKGYLYKSQIDQLSSIKQLQKAIGTDLDMWRTVMVAFYMDEVKKGSRNEAENDRDHDYAVEFLHKSLPEYLCAEYIWRQVKKRFLHQFQEEPDRALDDLYKIFRNKLISPEIINYLNQIQVKDKDIQDQHLYENLIEHIDFFINHDFYLDKNEPEALRTILITFYNYFSLLGIVKENISELYKSKINKKFLLLYRALSQFGNIYAFPLHGFDFREIDLSGINFSYVDLREAHFDNSTLVGARFSKANLRKASFSEANLLGANIKSANLDETDFFSANLEYANLYKATMALSDFDDANLDNAILEGCLLIGSSFCKSSLINVNLSRAACISVNFEDSDFQDILLQGTIFEEVNFRGVKNLTLDQLLQVDSLYECTGLSPEIMRVFQKLYPDKLNKTYRVR